MDYKKDVIIDPDNLDKEWERQPSLMQEYSEELSRLNRLFGIKSRVLKVNISKSKLSYRTGENKIMTVEKKPLKLTENALAEIIDSNEKLNNLTIELEEIKFNIDVTRGVVEALRAKKSALEWECQLYLSSYYGEPNDQRTLLKNKNRGN